VSVLGTISTNYVHDRQSHKVREQDAFINEASTFNVMVANYVQAIYDHKVNDTDYRALASGAVWLSWVAGFA
jgi:hypothetical protein